MSLIDNIDNTINKVVDYLTETRSLTPKVNIIVEGVDVSVKIHKRLSSLSLVDNRGFEADTFSMTIDDSDGLVNLPRRGAKVKVFLGFKELQMRDFGEYVIDSVECAGAPDNITINGKSADFRKKFLERNSKSHHQTTLGDIVTKIAGAHGWTPKVNKELAKIKIADKQQADESDANFLSRLAIEYDAIATVKSGHLLFLKAGECVTASGKPLPEIEIVRKNGDQHSFSLADRDDYTGVKAKYNNLKKGKRKEVVVGDKEKLASLRKVYKTEQDARLAAEAELKRIKRGAASLGFFLAKGDPFLCAESPVKVKGFKAEIDELDWVAIRVSHSLSGSGLTATVQCELRSDHKGDQNRDTNS